MSEPMTDVADQLRCLTVLVVPVVEAEGHRVQARVGQHHQRQEEVVPDRDELEQEHGDQGRRHDPQRHRAEDAALAGAVDPPGLDQVVGNRGGGVDPGQVDAERADDARQEHRPVRVGQADLAHQQVERQGQRGAGHEHAAQDDREDELAAAELVLGQRVPGRARQQRRAQRPHPGVQQGVDQPVPVDPAVVAEQPGQVGDEVQLAEPEPLRRVQRARPLRRGHDQPPRREQEVNRADEHERGGEDPGPGDPRRTRGRARVCASGHHTPAQRRCTSLRKPNDKMNVPIASTTAIAAA